MSASPSEHTFQTPRVRGAAQRVVLVEPNAQLRSAHVKALVGTGCMVIAVGSCSEALDALDRLPSCDCVLFMGVPIDEERTVRARLDELAHLRATRCVTLNLDPGPPRA